jgi:hypothetical protein
VHDAGKVGAGQGDVCTATGKRSMGPNSKGTEKNEDGCKPFRFGDEGSVTREAIGRALYGLLACAPRSNKAAQSPSQLQREEHG